MLHILRKDLTWAELSTAMQRFWAQVSHGDGSPGSESGAVSHHPTIWGGFIIRTITLEESSDGGSDKPFPKRRFSARFSKDGVCRGRRVVLVVTGTAFLHTL